MCIEVLNNLVLFKFYETNSLIQNMNSVVKIICTILFAILLFLSYNLYLNLLIAILLILLLLLSKIPIYIYFKTISNVKWFLIFILLINLIFKQDFYITILMILRIICLILYTMMILYATKQDEIVYGLQKVFSPLKLLKIPVSKMVFSISLALRFIPNLLLSYNQISKSQISRGIYYQDLSLKNKFDLLKNSITCMIVLSIKKADMLSDSLELKLYDVSNYNANLSKRINYFDLLLLLIHIMLFILIIKRGVFL